MLLGAQQPQGAVTIALDTNHRVDEVLQRSGPGEFTIFRDVTNEYERRAIGLGDGAEPLGGLAYLGHRAHNAREGVVAHGGDRIDHAEVPSAFFQ